MIPGSRRLEELSLNSSAPPGQLLFDGWLLRLAPGKAKRARSVNAVYSSTLALPDKIAYCERIYGGARLPALFRVTPFSEPPELDRELERRGYGQFDMTSVEAAEIAPSPGQGAGPDATVMNVRAWVDAVGELRGSPAEHRAGHLARLEGMPLAMRAVAIEREGRIVATGLTIVEDDCAGLFDIVTREDERRRGHARTVVASLLKAAYGLGARYSYLQVDSANEAARRLYREFGFSERYRYWYRGRQGEMH